MHSLTGSGGVGASSTTDGQLGAKRAVGTCRTFATHTSVIAGVWGCGGVHTVLAVVSHRALALHCVQAWGTAVVTTWNKQG